MIRSFVSSSVNINDGINVEKSLVFVIDDGKSIPGISLTRANYLRLVYYLQARLDPT